jgi:hopanoid biosynthesis associated radical SAM protein HpnH
MRFPVSLYRSMTSYLLRNMVTGRRVFPLVLMLEPTHRCDLRCAGCGRIREYRDTLDQEMTLQECLQAVDEAGPPVIAITGGEPLLYSRVDELVRAILARGKHIYFCTNGLLLEDSLKRFRPSPRFTWNVHLDGSEAVHDRIIGRPGGFRQVMAAIRAAKDQGFRVSTNTTVARDTSVDDLEQLFTQLADAGVDGILVTPGFSYAEVDDEAFLTRSETMEKFGQIREWSRRYPLISNPIYLDFLAGDLELACTPWGSPTRNPHGWKSPCYLLTDTHFAGYADFMAHTDWDHYASGRDPRCEPCMMHCGYEPTIVRSVNAKNLLRMIRWNLRV